MQISIPPLAGRFRMILQVAKRIVNVWRVPSSKALSCKHERLFDLLTLASFYSFRSAVTGSLFAALRDGIRPPMKVRNTLRPISTIAGSTGRDALT